MPFEPKCCFRFLVSFIDETGKSVNDERFPAFCVQTVRFLDDALSIGFVSTDGRSTLAALEPFTEHSSILLRVLDRNGKTLEDIVVSYTDEELLLGDLDYSRSDAWVSQVVLAGLTFETQALHPGTRVRVLAGAIGIEYTLAFDEHGAPIVDITARPVTKTYLGTTVAVSHQRDIRAPSCTVKVKNDETGEETMYSWSGKTLTLIEVL